MSDLTRRPHCQKLNMTGFVTTNRILHACNGAWRGSKRISQKNTKSSKTDDTIPTNNANCYYNKDGCNY